jgi:hypothetical protein
MCVRVPAGCSIWATPASAVSAAALLVSRGMLNSGVDRRWCSATSPAAHAHGAHGRLVANSRNQCSWSANSFCRYQHHIIGYYFLIPDVEKSHTGPRALLLQPDATSEDRFPHRREAAGNASVFRHCWHEFGCTSVAENRHRPFIRASVNMCRDWRLGIGKCSDQNGGTEFDQFRHRSPSATLLSDGDAIS